MVDGRALLSVQQVAKLLAVSTATVYGLIERDELEHVRLSNVIRIRPGSIERYLGGSR